MAILTTFRDRWFLAWPMVIRGNFGLAWDILRGKAARRKAMAKWARDLMERRLDEIEGRTLPTAYDPRTEGGDYWMP